MKLDFICNLTYISCFVLFVHGKNCSWFRQNNGLGFEPSDCELQNFSNKTEMYECLNTCNTNPQVRIGYHTFIRSACGTPM